MSGPDEATTKAREQLPGSVEQVSAGAQARSTSTRESWLNRVVANVIDHAWRWAIVMLASGWLLGVSVWPLVKWEFRSFLIANDLSPEQRGEVLDYGSYGIQATIALYIFVWLAWKRYEAQLSPWQAFERWTKTWCLTLTVPIIIALLISGMEKPHPALALFYICVVTTFVMVWVHRRPPPAADPERLPPLPKFHRDWGFAATAVLVVIYGCAMSYLSLVEHRNFLTHAFDLGIYDNVLWRTSNGDWLGCSLCKGENHASGHFDPILTLLVPLYRIWPRAETLLVFQSWWIASAGIPVYFIARRALRPSTGFAVSVVAVFLLHPALHGVNLFDFHSIALSIPLVAWLILCIDAKKPWAYAVALPLMLSVREDMPLIACFIGLYAIACRRVTWGLLTVVVSMAYLYVVKTEFMPSPDLLMQSSKSATSHIYYYVMTSRASWEFYGRSTELDELGAILARNRWFFLRLSGPRRIGKTTLIHPALPNARRNRYYIRDNFLRAWLSALGPAVQAVNFRPLDKLLAQADRDLVTAEGHGFERLVATLYEERSRKGIGDFALSHRIAGYWNRNDVEIDLVALDEDERTIRFGSCKRSAERLLEDRSNFRAHVDRFLSHEKKYASWTVEKVMLAPRLTAAQRKAIESDDMIAQDLVDLRTGL